ncbi:ATP-binding protein [archaeon]|jgi:uncharacterized protein|nr:ATP-binding protein [archaeon]
MKKEELYELLYGQQKDFEEINDLVDRSLIKDLKNLVKLQMPIIITGVRRCGKSSLLSLVKDNLHLKEKEFLYINFNDERFVGFEVSNFQDILNYIVENDYSKNCFLFIDEIQEVNNWEKWVDRIKSKFNIFITGSNSKLLSTEISTVLTGRSINISLYPFSFLEFLIFNKVELKNYKLDKNIQRIIKKNFKDYFENGGFPKMVKDKNRIILKEIYENIIYRDIVNRFNKNLIKPIKEISVYLQSNIATDLSLRTLSKISGIKNLATLKNILEAFESSFLFFSTNKFDYSVKKQIQNPKKIYSIDNGFSFNLGFKFSEDLGNFLENLVAIELKRREKDIFYHRKKNECDFVVREGKSILEAIQVCYRLNKENRGREINGLLDAMNKFKLKKGLILTYDDEEEIVTEGKKIIVKPVWKWLLE